MWHEERRARNSDGALTIWGWTSPRFWWMRLRGRVMDLPRLERGTAWTPLSAAERRTRMLARRVEKERASCMIGTGLRCNLTEESERERKGQGPGLGERGGGEGDGVGAARASLYTTHCSCQRGTSSSVLPPVPASNGRVPSEVE